MKNIVISIQMIVAAIILAIPCGTADAVVPPSLSDAGGNKSQLVQANVCDKIGRVRIQLKNTISDLTRLPDCRTDRLETIDQELSELCSNGDAGNFAGHQKDDWVPARIEWALKQESK